MQEECSNSVLGLVFGKKCEKSRVWVICDHGIVFRLFCVVRWILSRDKI